MVYSHILILIVW